MRRVSLLTGIILFLFGVNSLFAQNSVLSTGNWYKIAVENTGIHQITYDDLVDYGIDPNQVNPKNIRLYGNGNGMLPEDNEKFRYDDLQENSIFVFGEGDEVFDQGDYILFYGEGPVEWNLNEEKGWFEQEVNLYSEFTYYFITTDLGEGKRIEMQYSTIIPHLYTSTSFNDYAGHELEFENLIHSGKEWYGERFEETLEYIYEIEFLNIVTSHPVTFITDVAARSWAPSNFTFEINGQIVSSIEIPEVNYSSLNSDYAKDRWDSALFYTNSSTLNLTINYDNPTGSSIGWLNYFSFNGRRQNIFDAGQMQFRDLISADPGNVTTFQITSANENITIWNISDPINPTSIDYIYSNGIAEFILETDSLMEFAVFDESEFYFPQFETTIANQNLHGIEAPDMVIITHEEFLAEAQQLANFRESNDGITTFVTTPDKIYNEFSSGAQDITAIRDFMKYLYDKSGGEGPENLLLFGDGSFDYKDITNTGTNFIPVWESTESLNPVSSYCSDDYYSEFDEEDKTSMMKIGIGRLPAKTQAEANALVEKIIHYSSENAQGSWRNDFCLIADDEDGNIHFNNAEDIADIVDMNDPVFNVSKIFLDAYEQISNTNGQFYPDVNQAITDKINQGVNVINHIGHGFYNGLAHEKILTEDDLDNWENYNYYPVFFSASCSFGHFDDPEKYSLTEKSVLLEGRGFSSVIAATRATYAGANHEFQIRFFTNTMNYPHYSLGKQLKLAKQEAGGFNNNRKYCLFGDPSMKLAIPRYGVVTEAINGVPVFELSDTIQPGEQVIVSGYIVDVDGEPFYSFNGPMEISIYDRIDTITTLGNDPASPITDFSVRDSILLTVSTDVLNGQFAFTFNLPYDISDEYGTLKLSYYAKDNPIDARGQFSDLMAGGQPSAIKDYKPIDDLLTIYPIPVKSELNYLAKKNIQELEMNLFDLTGKQLESYSRMNIQSGNINRVDLSHLNTGLYIMQVRADDQISTLKVVKQ